MAEPTTTRTAAGTDTTERFSARRIFRPDAPGGALAIAVALIMLITPTLAYVFSQAFLVLLPIALILSLLAIPRLAQASHAEQVSRAGQAGYAMAFNGVLLIIGMFFVGILDDFVLDDEAHLEAHSVGLAFTVVHILLAIGLLLVDNFRHERRADI